MHEYLDINSLAIIEETQDIVTSQQYVNTLPQDNPGVLYLNNRFVSSDEKELFFYTDDIYLWFQKYVLLDEETLNYLNNTIKVTLKEETETFQTLGNKYKFIGFFGRNYDGQIVNVFIRNIAFPEQDIIGGRGGKTGKIKLFFFYDKKINKLVLLKTYPPYSIRDINLQKKYNEWFWHNHKKNKLNLEEPIIVTSSAFVSQHFNNSISVLDTTSAMFIPEKLKDKKLIYILDNHRTAEFYRIQTNLLKMGYTLFSWPKDLMIFLDFNKYAVFVYSYKNTVKIQPEKFKPGTQLPNLVFPGLRVNEKYIFPSDTFINEFKNILKKIVFSSKNLITNKDLNTFDERFTLKYE